MIAKRYSCPEFLLDGHISSNRLAEFVYKAWECNQEDFLWNFWLAKVNNGKSFNDFRRTIEQKPVERPSDDEIRAIIESSRSVLNTNEFEDSV